MILLPVQHQQQRQQTDCLAACAGMVLDYLHLPYTYEGLLRLLRVGSMGTQFSNLYQLETWGLSVLLEHGELTTLRAHLEVGLPVIAFVNTGNLAYWSYPTNHAIVISGYEDNQLYLLDPDLDHGPILFSEAEFELAWIDREQIYAVIRLTKEE
jgi:ABC-type bacteriocin/lantibiotic exporter with double-glycine peptidase domain